MTSTRNKRASFDKPTMPLPHRGRVDRGGRVALGEQRPIAERLPTEGPVAIVRHTALRVASAVLLLASMLSAAPARAVGLDGAPPATRVDSAAVLVAPAPAGDVAALTSPAAAVIAESIGLHESSSGIPVYLGGEEIFNVRVGRDGLDPEGRASAIRSRLRRAVQDHGAPAESAKVVLGARGLEVWLGAHFLWVITPADARVSSISDLPAHYPGLRERVQAGIDNERRARRPGRLLLSAGIAILLTIAAYAAQRLVRLAGARWRGWLDDRLAGRLPALRFRSFEILSQKQIAGGVGGVLGRLDFIASAFLLYLYLAIGFSLFPWTQGWSERLLRFALSRSVEILRAIASGVPSLLTLAIIAILFRGIVRLADRFFDAIESGTLKLNEFHPELARPSKRLARILLWLIALMIAYPYVPGSQSKAVQGVSILLGLMLSLGSTGFVGNVIAGLILTYSRAFRVGDRVQIGEHVGDIVGLGFFATKLRTIRNEEVTIPNGQVAAAAILNYTRLAEQGGLTLHTEVTIGYDTPWRTVHDLLIGAAANVEGIVREPAPRVYQRALNDFHVSYELNCVTCDSHAQLRLYSDIHAEIQDAFSSAGVEILSPGYHAVRDANAPVLPGAPEGPCPDPRGFRFVRCDEK